MGKGFEKPLFYGRFFGNLSGKLSYELELLLFHKGILGTNYIYLYNEFR